jgi:peptidoglycan/LPS O-acetylase OafA/YrhL
MKSKTLLEIQGLRAIAVAFVVFFHIWPAVLPGGYVGVDIFFVISGFLISAHLLRELEEEGSLRFGRFYLRRARRLLPLALLVIFVTVLLMPVALPPSRWAQAVPEAIASAAYFENWYLAHLATDYLGAAEAPSAFQHYWSLSVEEQFYIFWPLLMALPFWLLKTASKVARRRAAFGVLCLAIVSSFAFSALSLINYRGQSYFFTHLRVWEFGAGALLAFVTVRPQGAIQSLLSWIGLVTLAASGILFSSKVHFPGVLAIAPVIGAVLIIFAGQPTGRFSTYPILSSVPFVKLGDISYSVYLWHWPIVVFYKARVGSSISLVEGVALFALTVAMSIFSKRYVEDGFRSSWGRTQFKRAAITVVGAAIATAVVWGAAYWRVDSQRREIADHPQNYPGAAVLTGASTVPDRADFAPPLALLKFDKAPVYDNGCHLGYDEDKPVGCPLGAETGATTIYLIGDSHAANWIPALSDISKSRGWKLVSFTKSSCPLVDAMLEQKDLPYEACKRWGADMMRRVAHDRPSLVILAQMRTAQVMGASDQRAFANALARTWRDLGRSGVKLVVIDDTPEWAVDPDACLFRTRSCAFRPNDGGSLDPIHNAARVAGPSVKLIDMNPFVCPQGNCPATIGNVAVWRDRHHLTASYSHSLAPILGKMIEEAVHSHDQSAAESTNSKE